MARLLRRSNLKPYVVSAVIVFIATTVTIGVEPLFDGKAPLSFLTIAVILSAGYGGIGTGLFAVALSLGITLLLFQNNILLLGLVRSSFTLFAMIGVLVTVVVGKLRGLNEDLTQAKNRLETSNRDLELANEKLSEQTELLSRSNEELQRFAHAMAHDFNNPLRTVGALTELLIERNAERLDDESKKCAHFIEDGVQRMTSMLNDLLTYATVTGSPNETGRISDCNLVVGRVLQDLRSIIQDSKTVITIDPLPIVGMSESHLAQVFSNLIGNAIKYRSPDGARIHVSATEAGPDWLLSVKDNGIGLDMRYADEIFFIFRRLHAAEEYTGSGVGLALCQAVIKRSGGRIWVESEPGNGSTFFFTIPKATGEP